MFWRVTSLAQSPVEQVLDKADYTLSDLLDEDEIVQEARALNSRLVAFLSKPSTVRQLVDYIVEPPAPDADRKVRFKYPFAACEVLCCEIDSVFSVLLGEGDFEEEEEEDEEEEETDDDDGGGEATEAAAASAVATSSSGAASLPENRDDDASSSSSPSSEKGGGENTPSAASTEAAATEATTPAAASKSASGTTEAASSSIPAAAAASAAGEESSSGESGSKSRSGDGATSTTGGAPPAEEEKGAAAPTEDSSTAPKKKRIRSRTGPDKEKSKGEREDLLARLFSILDAPRPLECARAGYFARVVARLLARRTAAVMSFLRARPEALRALVSHVDTASVAEVVARLLGADDAMGLPASELSWLRGSGVLTLLLEQLDDGPSSAPAPEEGDGAEAGGGGARGGSPSSSADAQRHAAAVLAAVVRAHGSPLLSAFAEQEFVDALLSRALASGKATPSATAGNPSVQALEVAVALLEPKEPPADPYLLSPAAAAAAAEVDIATKDAAVAGVVARLPDLVALLDAPPATTAVAAPSAPFPAPLSPEELREGNVQLTPYGVLRPPLGLTRIKAVALLVALLRSGRSDAVAGVVASGAVGKCLDLFLAYPFNNLLHHHVAALLLTALDGVSGEGDEEEASPSGSPPSGPAALLAHVLRDVNLPRWLASAPAEVRPIPLPGDARAASGKRAPLRAGYLGHVTHLGNRLLALAASGNAAVADALLNEPSWRPWAEGDLRQRTERDDPDGWECGRPAPPPPAFGGGLMGADSLDAEDDDEDDDDDDGAGRGYGGWGAPALRRASGGGDSSDDDDGDSDDEGEGDGVVRAELRMPKRGTGARSADAATGGTAAALDLQELAEAAASVGALRISGEIVSSASAPGANGGGEGSPTLSSSSDSSSSDDDDEGASSSSSSDSSDDDEDAAAAAASVAAAVAPSGAATAAAAKEGAASADAPGWAAFPEIEGGGGGSGGDGDGGKK